MDVDTPRDLIEPFENDLPILIDWLDTVAERLAPVLVSIECVLDPAALVFGGRLPNPLLNALLQRLETRLPALRTEGLQHRAEFRRASVGADAGALGVATLPIYTLFAPSPTRHFSDRTEEYEAFFS